LGRPTTVILQTTPPPTKRILLPKAKELVLILVRLYLSVLDT
jgi:hypothetical protein